MPPNRCRMAQTGGDCFHLFLMKAVEKKVHHQQIIRTVGSDPQRRVGLVEFHSPRVKDAGFRQPNHFGPALHRIDRSVLVHTQQELEEPPIAITDKQDAPDAAHLVDKMPNVK